MRLLLPDKCQEGVGNRKIVIKLLLYFILFVKQVAVLHIKLQLDTNLILTELQAFLHNNDECYIIYYNFIFQFGIGVIEYLNTLLILIFSNHKLTYQIAA